VDSDSEATLPSEPTEQDWYSTIAPDILSDLSNPGEYSFGAETTDIRRV